MSRHRLIFGVNPVVVLLALIVTAVDALSKLWARRALAAHAVHLFSAVWLRLQYNSGISFSINQSGPLLTTVLTVGVALVVVAVGVRASAGAPAIGFGLLLGEGWPTWSTA